MNRIDPLLNFLYAVIFRLLWNERYRRGFRRRGWSDERGDEGVDGGGDVGIDGGVDGLTRHIAGGGEQEKHALMKDED